MRHFQHFLLFSVIFFAGNARGAELLPIKIIGVDELLEAQIRSAIALPESDSKSSEISEGRLSYYLSSLDQLVEASLEPLGFYHANVSSQVTRDGARVQIQLHVKLGEPVKVLQQQIGVNGAAEKDRFIGFWLEGFEPKIGEVFNHSVYESNKASITQALLDRGYFDQQNTEHSVKVLRASNSADVHVQWSSGLRYRYGEVRFEGNRFKPGLLDKLINFERGKYYSQPQVNRLQESLTKLNYFNSIQIVPDVANKVGDEVPVVIMLSEAKRRNQHASIRFGSETGLGVEYGVEQRWINTRGHKLDYNIAWAQREQAVSALYRVPAFNWLDGWYGFGITARNEEYLFTPNRYVELTANRSGEIRNWDLLASVNVRRERFDEFIPFNDPNNPINLYTSVWYAEFNATWRTLDDSNYPRKGSSWSYQARAGYEFETTQAAFAQILVRNKRVIGLSDGDRLLLRAEAGALWTQAYDLFPPSLRFYAGGDQSIRGYDYKEVGEYILDLNLGGRYLVVASVEYEHRLNNEWAVAGFLDAGDAFDVQPNVNFGAGVGARWHSPIGPVRVDLAYGFNGPKPGFGLHFTLGADL